MPGASQGDTVRIHYKGRLPSGTVFDSTDDSEPLKFTLGQGDVIDGVDQAVLGMEQGEEKTVTIAPEQGFGEHNAALAQTVARGNLPDEVKVGDRLRAVQDDKELQVWVSEIHEDSVVVDANHPLAGQVLNFDVAIEDVREASDEELDHGHVH